MTHPILVPLDGSELSVRILESISPLLREEGQELLLLSVVPNRGTGPDQAERLDVATAQLEAVAATLREQGIRTTQRLERGDPAERILEVAGEPRVELVAMSTHGRTGTSRLLRGSVAERVLRESPVPILLCNPEGLKKTPEDNFKKILVPLDGSALSDRALPFVERIARAYGSRVTLLRVAPPLSLPLPSASLAEVWDMARLRESLEPQRQSLLEAGVDVVVNVAMGAEAAEILAAAGEADLVAMTTHGRGGVSRWWYGSVAESVVRECPCPLLILRTREG